MPAGASDPSAGDAGNTAALEPQGTKRDTYKCPEDFVSFTHKPCSSTLRSSLRNGNSELWLIKAPASFNPQQFNGVTVPLSGLQTVRVAATNASGGGARQCVYSVLGTARTPPDLHLLTADGASLDRVVCGPAFSGVLNVCEMHGDGGGHALLHPQAIPAAPAPAIPPGLKQRFLPFGSKMPTLTYVGESELDAGAAGPSSATLRPLVVKCFPAEEEEAAMTEEERRKERKRRRREKRIKLESQDPGEEEVTMVAVKTEPVGLPFQTEEEEQQSVEAGLPYQEEGRRKKKKRKKDKENERDATQAPAPEEVPGGYEEEKEEEVTVKCEPMDIAYEDPEGSAKKKKKKRKSRVEEA